MNEYRVYTIRRKLFTRVMSTMGVLLFLWAFTFSVGPGSGDKELSSAIPIPLVASLCIFGIAVLRFSCIRVSGCGITVEDGFVYHFIPWGDVRRIGLDGGLRIHLHDGSEVQSIQFGGSLLGEFSGYRTYRPYVKKMRNSLNEFKERGEGASGERVRKFMFPRNAFLVCVASFFILYFSHMANIIL